jgi:hypothetical protein
LANDLAKVKTKLAGAANPEEAKQQPKLYNKS